MDADAVELVARRLYDRMADISIRVGWENEAEWLRETYRKMATDDLKFLTSPRTVECETCRGSGSGLATAAPGVCVDIDGQWWHEPGSCSYCKPAPECEPCSGSGRIEKGPIAYLAGELSLGPSRGARKDEPVKRLRIFWQYVRVFTVGVWGWMRGPR